MRFYFKEDRQKGNLILIAAKLAAHNMHPRSSNVRNKKSLQDLAEK